jgi:tRNA pseudouridine13 synthase
VKVPGLDKEIGIESYATETKGIGGKIRRFPDDFQVEEVLDNGSQAHIAPRQPAQIHGRGRYLLCVLIKRNLDTIRAVQEIARTLRIDSERIHIAGIKDARAVTAQYITISRMLPQEVAGTEFDGFHLYPISYSSEKLSPKLLLGNHFNIVVRNIALSAESAQERTECIAQQLASFGGCPNFFGHQRFGTIRSITHLVGKHILLGEWERAALTFLAKPSPFEHPESRRVRDRLWNTQNYAEALQTFPHRLLYERQMLSHLANRPGDFKGSFYRLPLKLRQLFVQAYQSYLFNRFLSCRIQMGLPLKESRTGEYTIKANGEERFAIPLVGYGQALSSGEQGEIEKKVLQTEDFTPERFRVHDMEKVSSSGGLRSALTPVIEFKIKESMQDSASSEMRMMVLGFDLRKGSYATVVLREIMKPEDPVAAGF